MLTDAGYVFELGPFPDVDETPSPGLDPLAAVCELARRKAQAVASAGVDKLVLTADTLVFADGEALGKPRDEAEARAMLARLSGRTHQVATGVGLVGPDGRGGTRVEAEAASTRVRFRTLDPTEIEAYVATGEPLDKAGAYAIQGGAAAFVASIEGSWDTVVGLPLDVVRRLIARFG